MNFKSYRLEYTTGDIFFDGVYFYFPLEKEKVSIERVTRISLPYSTYRHEQKVIIEFKSLQDHDLKKAVLINSFQANEENVINGSSPNAEEIIYRFNNYYQSLDRRDTVLEAELESIEIHRKNLYDLRSYFFLGRDYAIFERDGSRLRWFFFASIVIMILFYLGFDLLAIILSISATIIYLIYYEGLIKNFSIRRFRDKQYYNIKNEINLITLKIETVLKRKIPGIDPDTFRGYCYSSFDHNKNE